MIKSALILLTLSASVWSHAQDSVSVLFIGNSYTYVNDLPDVTRQLAASLGKELTVGSKTNGGFSFQNQCGDPLTWNAMHQRNWDVVVLQGQSQEPSFPDEQVNSATIPLAMQLADSVYAINPCSNVLLYMTWGRENGDPQWAPISTFNGMNERLYNAYMRIADSTEGMVAAAGASWKYVRDTYPAIQLYSGDGSHPSLAGTYLTACTLYASLFQSPVTGAAYFAGLDAQTAVQLQSAADHVILDSLDHFKLHAISEPVQAHFTVIQNESQAAFTTTSTRATYYNWEFGDGNGSSEGSPVHVYSTLGSYQVRLIAGNTCTADTTVQFIQVLELGINEISPNNYKLLEFNSHFLVSAFTKPIYYEIYTADGKITHSGEILTSENQEISKPASAGIIVLKNQLGEQFVRKYVRW